MNTLKFAFLAATVASSVLLTACGKDDNETGKVLATVNGDKIYEGQIAKQMEGLPPQLVQGREGQIRQQLVDALIQQELIKQEAKKLNVADEAAFKEQLEQAKQQLMAAAVVQKKVDEVLTPEVLQQAYDATKAQRAFPAVKARHILVATEAEANNLIKVANPSNFSQLAAEKSIGPSKSNGGELGWFRREAMVPEFANVAFATPAGQVASKPVKTQFGWHVILVEDKNDAYIPPFEQVAGELKQELSQQVAQGYMAELRKGATITYSDAISATAVEPAAAPAQ
ncbi:MAG: peptidylprolyl isomerase [Pseudomonadaceae bacterium]|nr:peptidylprolyl isomerase [Pseudomonadaceae bacterium]